MAAAPPTAAARGSNAHFSDLLRALWAPGPCWPSALVIWPILLKVELIERIDLLRVGRHSPNNYLTFAAVTCETSGASAARRSARRRSDDTCSAKEKQEEVGIESSVESRTLQMCCLMCIETPYVHVWRVVDELNVRFYTLKKHKIVIFMQLRHFKPMSRFICSIIVCALKKWIFDGPRCDATACFGFVSQNHLILGVLV